MCVIMIGNKKAPKENDVKAMWSRNSDGAGVSWNDGYKVHYVKGIMEVKHLLQFLKGSKATEHNYVIHFRLSSVGGKGRELTHPFLVDRTGENPLTYSGKRRVLFHNGHDSHILDKMFDMMVLNRLYIPVGAWSDSRATALLASYSGVNVCNLVSGKFVIVSPDNIIKYGDFTEKDGFFYSNMFWDYGKNRFAGGDAQDDDQPLFGKDAGLSWRPS